MRNHELHPAPSARRFVGFDTVDYLLYVARQLFK